MPLPTLNDELPNAAELPELSNAELLGANEDVPKGEAPNGCWEEG